MNRIHSKLLLSVLVLMLVFAFNTTVFASDTDSYYTDEEAYLGDDTALTVQLNEGILPSAKDGNLVIVLDPGHGPADSGAPAIGNAANESDMNLAVAKYCKAYLEKYANVTVYLTHYDNSGSKKLELTERAAIAAGYNADLFISLHFNSAGSSAKGAEVYVSVLDEYKIDGLAAKIVDYLGDLGLSERGVKTRESGTGDRWTDGVRIADYYGVIRGACKQEIPSMIVEHCFISNSSDYNNFASTQAKLKALGEADAKAILSYYGLDKSTSATTLENSRYTALQALNNQYLSMDLFQYNGNYRTKINAIYRDAKERIEIATNTGKIDVTLNRAVKTLQNYPKLKSNETIFVDMPTDAWYRSSVEYCVENGLFYGTSDAEFSPNDPITRGQFIAVLGRMEGVAENPPAQTKFSDVDPGQYYAPHIRWATEQGIVSGLSDTVYGPNENIRREDLLRMIHNYCTVKNIELPTVSNKTTADFTDGNTVDTWAKDDVAWALAKGIITGYEDKTLRPTNSTSRAEVAQIMMNIHKKVL